MQSGMGVKVSRLLRTLMIWKQTQTGLNTKKLRPKQAVAGS